MVNRCHTIHVSGGIEDLDLDGMMEESATNEMGEGRAVTQRKANAIDLVYMEDSEEDDSMYK